MPAVNTVAVAAIVVVVEAIGNRSAIDAVAETHPSLYRGPFFPTRQETKRPITLCSIMKRRAFQAKIFKKRKRGAGGKEKHSVLLARRNAVACNHFTVQIDV